MSGPFNKRRKLMNEEIAKDLLNLHKKEVNLVDLKQQTTQGIIEKALNAGPKPVKIKLFSITADNREGRNVQKELETEINNFLLSLNPFRVEDINVGYSKTFLPGTVSGEYQETWYGMVKYQDED